MPQEKFLMWENKESRSIEYFTLHDVNGSFVLKGTVILPLEQLPTKVSYSIKCDYQWRTRRVHLRQEQPGKTSQLTLTVNKEQDWKENKSTVSFAKGLFDVDFEISPATNTLPIRRLSLKVGESRTVDAVWVRFPSLKIGRLQQRYTRIDERCYKYEALSSDYEAHLEVDDAGLIVRYDKLWKQIP